MVALISSGRSPLEKALAKEGQAAGLLYGNALKGAKSATQTQALTSQAIIFIPVVFDRAFTATGVAFEKTSAGSVNGRVGLYASSSRAPSGTPLAESINNNISSAAGYEISFASSYACDKETLYWICLGNDGTAPTLEAYSDIDFAANAAAFGCDDPNALPGLWAMAHSMGYGATDFPTISGLVSRTYAYMPRLEVIGSS